MKGARSELNMNVLVLGCLNPEIKSQVKIDYGEILFCLTSFNYEVKIHCGKNADRRA